MNNSTSIDFHTAVTSEDTSSTIPGQVDMWVFVLFEGFVFTLYFAVYMFSRASDYAAYLESQGNLSLVAGVVNTLLLLISSWSMARCVQASRLGDTKGAMKNALLTVGFGLAFMGSKIYEWKVKGDAGISYATDEFFAFYYFLTAIHFVHLLIGFVFLALVILQLRKARQRNQEVIETSATYWHMVDFLWVNIFALLYVLR